MSNKIDQEIVNSIMPFTRTIFKPDKTDGMAFFASGVLLRMETQFYLITAAHVIDSLTFSQPLFFDTYGGRLEPIEGVIISSHTEEPNRRSDDKVDIGIVKFCKSKNANLENLAYITLKNIDQNGSVNPELGFAFVGHPESKNRNAINNTTKQIHPFLYGAVCTEAEATLYSHVGASLKNNILLNFNKKRVYDLEGNPRTAPNLNALSGAPIWGRHTDGSAKVVGILIEHHSTKIKCIVGTRALPIMKLLKELENSNY